MRTHAHTHTPARTHLDLWQAARRWRDAHEVKLAQQLVVSRHLALPLEHLDADLPSCDGMGDVACDVVCDV
jgi:hypothetical protein